MSFNDPDAHYDLAIAYAEMGLVTDAIRELEEAIRLNPEHPRAQAAAHLLERLRGRRDRLPNGSPVGH